MARRHGKRNRRLAWLSCHWLGVSVCCTRCPYWVCQRGSVPAGFSAWPPQHGSTRKWERGRGGGGRTLEKERENTVLVLTLSLQQNWWCSSARHCSFYPPGKSCGQRRSNVTKSTAGGSQWMRVGLRSRCNINGFWLNLYVCGDIKCLPVMFTKVPQTLGWYKYMFMDKLTTVTATNGI